MLLLHKLWFAICYTSFLTRICISDRVHNIIWLTSVERFVGQNTTLMWNTTNNRPIKSAIFGLSKEGMADPQFINVNMLTGKVHHNPKITKTYYGRVDFVGNLTAGRAWFIIKNLQLNDTNEYIARITVQVDNVMSYAVKLKVKQSKEFQTQKESTASSITTKGWRSLNETVGKGPFGTTSTPPVESMRPVLKYALASFLIILILAFILVVGWFWKKRNKSRTDKQRVQTKKEDYSIKLLITNNNTEEKLPEKNLEERVPEKQELKI